jgi:hypothetical protein
MHSADPSKVMADSGYPPGQTYLFRTASLRLERFRRPEGFFGMVLMPAPPKALLELTDSATEP